MPKQMMPCETQEFPLRDDKPPFSRLFKWLVEKKGMAEIKFYFIPQNDRSGLESPACLGWKGRAEDGEENHGIVRFLDPWPPGDSSPVP